MRAVTAVGWRVAARAALPVWLGSRVAVVLTSLAATWTLAAEEARDLPGFLAVWDRWDVGLFRKVAQYGYFSPAYDDQTVVDFPGLPLLLRAVHLVVRDWIVAGLVVSLVASAVACVALWRLGAAEGGPVAGHRAVLYLVLFPYAVFLFAGYSEALFLAFAVPSWLAAREGRWRTAGLLAGGAAFTRVTGLCLAAALGVEYLVSRRRLRPDVLWLAAPLLAVGAYFGYLYARTGDWAAYATAQRTGWGREFPVDPRDSLATTLSLARRTDWWAPFTFEYRVEIAVVAVGLLLTGALIARRRFGEATYVGTSVAMLMLTSYYASGTRAALLWFPLYLLLARASLRREWVHGAVVWTAGPLMVVFVAAFVRGAWLG